jgi:CNT family concentrative nucleoside transporter
MGTQLIATEFVAYLDLASAIKAGSISPRSAQMAAYALCGFANLPSIAIQIGGLSAMAPGRRADAASLGLKAMTAGALACWSTAAIAGAFL